MLLISGFTQVLRSKNLWRIMTTRLSKQERLAAKAVLETEPNLGAALQRKVLLPKSSAEICLWGLTALFGGQRGGKKRKEKRNTFNFIKSSTFHTLNRKPQWFRAAFGNTAAVIENLRVHVYTCVLVQVWEETFFFFFLNDNDTFSSLVCTFMIPGLFSGIKLQLRDHNYRTPVC